MKKIFLFILILLLTFSLAGCGGETDPDLEMDEYAPSVIEEFGDEYEDHTFFEGRLQIKAKTDNKDKLVLAHQTMNIAPKVFGDKDEVDKLVILWMTNLDSGDLVKIATIEMSRGAYERIDWDSVSQYDLEQYIKMAPYAQQRN